MKLSKNEIQTLEIFKYLFENKKHIFKACLFSIIIGTIYLIQLPNKYTSSITILPQYSDENTLPGGLSNIASITGFEIQNQNTSVNISPKLYPQIINNPSFFLKLSNEIISNDEGKNLSIKDYVNENNEPNIIIQTIFFFINSLKEIVIKPDKIDFKDDTNLNFISNEEQDVIDYLSKNIDINVNTRDGFIELISTMNDKISSAQILEIVTKNLQNQIIELKIKKHDEELLFLENRLEVSKNNLKKISYKLATFKEENRFLENEVTKINLSDLENEYTLSFTVYSDLSRKVENQKLKVEKNTPIFTNIQNINIPNKKSSPSRLNILILLTIITVIFDSIFLIIKKSYLD